MHVTVLKERNVEKEGNNIILISEQQECIKINEQTASSRNDTIKICVTTRGGARCKVER